MDNILDPNEQVLWSDKPEKKSFMLPGFGGIPFALAFSVAFILLLNFGLPQLGPPGWSYSAFTSYWPFF